MARDFYPFVEEGTGEKNFDDVSWPARIAVYDDAAAAPRVLVVEPRDVRGYLEEITATVSRLVREQGGTIPFMVIREIVENFIHAYFMSPTISILDGGNTIRFSDQGPGIREKERALEFGTTSATEDMKRYIRGVGSGLPYVQQYMMDKGGSLSIEDNINAGTVVTISTGSAEQASVRARAAEERNTQAANPAGFTGMAGATRPEIEVSQRGRAALAYLSTHDCVGPSDLVREQGGSAPTWSRVLAKELEVAGLVRKEGQKYRLTTVGRTYLP